MRLWGFILCIISMAVQADKVSYDTLLADGETELSVARYPADGDTVLIWIAPGYGFNQNHADSAQALNALGIEVWQVNLMESLFLPSNARKLRALEGRYVAHLIADAHKQTQKQVVLFGTRYATAPILRGVREWQLAGKNTGRVLGAAFLSPNLYQGIPALGELPEYLPITQQSNIPILILQASDDSSRWQLPRLLPLLQKGGAKTYTRLLKGVRGLFFFRDHSAEERHWYQQFPKLIQRFIPQAAKLAPRHEASTVIVAEKTQTQMKRDIRIKDFRGNPVPPALALKDTDGNLFSLNDYTGKVTLVNFWATWCPPCVEEIPSLNHLREAMEAKYGDRFSLVSIDFAESPELIENFLAKVHVDFPVLLDTDGKVTAEWKVFAFPSSFLIGLDGRIRYGVNAAIDWNSDQVHETIAQLMQAKP